MCFLQSIGPSLRRCRLAENGGDRAWSAPGERFVDARRPEGSRAAYLEAGCRNPRTAARGHDPRQRTRGRDESFVQGMVCGVHWARIGAKREGRSLLVRKDEAGRARTVRRCQTTERWTGAIGARDPAEVGAQRDAPSV